ncbi:MAG: hypothetical protein AAF772_00850 [Acidobacteriota bacterium]
MHSRSTIPNASDARRARRLDLSLTLGALALCAGYVLAEMRRVGHVGGLPLDDGWIHLQFARQLADGAGLAYNPGQWVTGSTAPLWTALLAVLTHLGDALGAILPGTPALWTVVLTKLFGAGLFALCLPQVRRLGLRLGLPSAWAVCGAVLVALTPWLLWSALSAMEIPLFLLLSLLGIRRHLDERSAPPGSPAAAPVSLALLAAAVLARPEGYLLLLLAFADRLVRVERDDGALRVRLATAGDDVRALVWGGLLALVVLGPTLLYHQVIGGSILPGTFAVKGSAPRDLWPSAGYLRTASAVLFRSQPLLLLAALGGLAAWLTARRAAPDDPSDRGDDNGDARIRSLLPGLWLLGLPLAYAVLAAPDRPAQVGNFGRYLFPLLPWVVLFGLRGFAAALPRGAALLVGGRRLSIAVLGAALLIGVQTVAVVDGAAMYAHTVDDVERSDVAAARWLAPRLPAEALIAVQDIGALKYFLPNTVLDLAGIVTPEILPVLFATAPDLDPSTYWERRLLDFLARPDRRPDYFVVFPNSYPLITSGQVPGFEPVARFPVPDNRTMAGSELVIFRTPWLRYPLRELGGHPLREPGPSPADPPSR